MSSFCALAPVQTLYYTSSNWPGHNLQRGIKGENRMVSDHRNVQRSKAEAARKMM